MDSDAASDEATLSSGTVVSLSDRIAVLRSPALAVIVANSLLAAAGVSLISPALPAIQGAFSLTEPPAGLILVVFSLPSIALAPIMGIVTDHHGRRVVLVPCLLGYGFAGSAIPLAPDFTTLLVLRFLQGCGASGLITLSLTLVGDCFSGSRQNAVMGLNTAATTIGVAVFPILGGYLAEIRWFLPFTVYGMSGFVGIFVHLALEEPDIKTGMFGSRYLRRAANHVLTWEGVFPYAVVFLLFLLFFGGVSTAVPFLLSQSFKLRASQIGLVLSVPLIASSLVALGNGSLARFYSNYQLIALGFVGYGLGMAGMWIATDPFHVAATLAVLGGGHGFVIPSIDTAISVVASDDLRGGVMSLRISVKKIGQTAGLYLFATLGSLITFPAILSVSGVLTFVVGLFGFMMLQRTSPNHPQTG